MSFMDSLAANPNSGIYSSGGGGRSDSDTLNIVHQLKDRELSDFKDKANFMSDLSLKQDRLRNLYDPNKVNPGQGPQQSVGVQQVKDPNAMTGHEQADIGIRQQGMNLEQQRINQQGRLGEERLGIQTAQEQLNQQKSDQINAGKQAEHERKLNEAQEKIRVSEAKLESTKNDAAAHIAAQKEHMDAMTAYHNADTARREHEFSVKTDQHNQQIKDLETRLKQGRQTKVTTEISPDGTRRTVNTLRGDAANTVKVTGKDGKTYEIPADKQEEWDSQHSPSEELEGKEE